MINLRVEGMKLLPRLFLMFEGVTYPNGGVPRLYRWLTTDRARVRRTLEVIDAWHPTRVLFCHGEPIDLPAADLLAREFAYVS